MKNPQLLQNLPLCIHQAHLSTQSGIPLTDHCVKTWFSKKLLLAKPPLKYVFMIWLSKQLGRKCLGSRVLCCMTLSTTWDRGGMGFLYRDTWEGQDNSSGWHKDILIKVNQQRVIISPHKVSTSFSLVTHRGLQDDRVKIFVSTGGSTAEDLSVGMWNLLSHPGQTGKKCRKFTLYFEATFINKSKQNQNPQGIYKTPLDARRSL